MFFKKKKDFAESKIDFAIIGLGNPGSEYDMTRHNTGFMCVDYIAQKLGASFKKLKFKSYFTLADFGDKRVLLVKPQTFMNKSGEAVVDILDFYKIESKNAIVIFDDVSLDVGKIRIRRKGSDGGHNGMKNIIYLSGKDDFPRIKVGIGAKPNPQYDLAKWVLSKFHGDEVKDLETATENVYDAVRLMINGQTDKAMNNYN